MNTTDLDDFLHLLRATAADDREDIRGLVHRPRNGNGAQRRSVSHLLRDLLERSADALLMGSLRRVVSDRGPVLDLGLGLELALRNATKVNVSRSLMEIGTRSGTRPSSRKYQVLIAARA